MAKPNMDKEIISIAVISYNSSNTILETLDSILLQDYGCAYIELLIGDDGSTDDTQNLINSWVKENQEIFHNVILNLNSKNQGVAFNFNSICSLATSEWLKFIAADDILNINCITEFYQFIVENKSDIKCVFSKVEKFKQTTMLGIYPKSIHCFNLSAEKQFQSLLVDNFIPAPGCFIKVSILREMGFAELGMVMEDYPLWLKITSNGIKLHLLNKVLVRYRISESISKSDKRIINIRLNDDVYKCKKKYLLKLNVNIFHKLLYIIDIMLFRMADIVKIKILKNKKSKLSRYIEPLVRLFSPLYLIRRIKNSIN